MTTYVVTYALHAVPNMTFQTPEQHLDNQGMLDEACRLLGNKLGGDYLYREEQDEDAEDE